MRTLYYYFKWLFKQVKIEFDPIYVLFLSVILFLTGIFMNGIGMTVHSRIDPITGRLTFWKDEYWATLGDKFMLASFALFVSFIFWRVVIEGFRTSFARFKQEQHDLLFKIDTSDKRGKR